VWQQNSVYDDAVGAQPAVILCAVTEKHRARSPSSDKKPGFILNPKNDKTFTHAAFNDSGNLLYAWAYGKELDHLYIWRIENGRTILKLEHEGLPLEHEGHYHSVRIIYINFGK
jgi:hypothetical protein